MAWTLPWTSRHFLLLPLGWMGLPEGVGVEVLELEGAAVADEDDDEGAAVELDETDWQGAVTVTVTVTVWAAARPRTVRAASLVNISRTEVCVRAWVSSWAREEVMEQEGGLCIISVLYMLFPPLPKQTTSLQTPHTLHSTSP